LLGLVLALEIRPMIQLIRWRVDLARGITVDTRAAPALARIGAAQALLVLLMVLAATAMARGFGAF
jgi:putative membrane protein